MPNSKTKKRKKLLSHTRPPFLQQQPTLSSHATRSMIRSHHVLQKQLTRARAVGDTSLVSSLEAELDSKGGLELYQRASLAGQSHDRGGDTSKVLMEWLTATLETRSNDAFSVVPPKKLKMLEVGALSTTNACSQSGIFDVERIDLHSQHEEILQQDFMDRPLPSVGNGSESEGEGFDIVSLSLVVNYVGDAAGRGQMLRHVAGFLRASKDDRWGRQGSGDEDLEARSIEAQTRGELLLPALFLVLPKACVSNSRYLDERRLGLIMEELGYELARRKEGNKLVYWLWRWLGKEKEGKGNRGKEEIRKGSGRNNFAIVLT
ncbi:hypothetical protein MMC09_002335 [Bachmanniomyces sp. S44760]|nr:hypothetical protein [Bachmanniomyces sp. S44760]